MRQKNENEREYDKKNTFDIEKYLNRRMKLKAEEEFDVIQA